MNEMSTHSGKYFVYNVSPQRKDVVLPVKAEEGRAKVAYIGIPSHFYCSSIFTLFVKKNDPQKGILLCMFSIESLVYM